MRCIYFNGKLCESCVSQYGRFCYKPSEEEKKKLCDGKEFQICPRFQAFIDHLKATTKGS